MDTINQAAIESTDNSYWVEQKEALDRLYKNPDFKKVILDGYLVDRAVQGTSLLATDYVKRNGLRTDVMEGLIAVSTLEDHFHTIKNMGSIAEQEIEEAVEEELEATQGGSDE